MLYLSITTLLVLGLIPGLAQGLAIPLFGTSSNGNNRAVKEGGSNQYVPTSIPVSRTSLLQPGYFFTSPQNGSNFQWVPTSPQYSPYTADNTGVDLIINSAQQYQAIDGFGGGMTDSSASLLFRMKQLQPTLYNRVMDFMFNSATGVGITRATMGASDFSVNTEYDYVPNPPGYYYAGQNLNNTDALLVNFTMANTQTTQWVIPTLRDAKQRNPGLKVVLSPWSPPGFMKSSGSMNYGVIRDGFIPLLANYYGRVAAAWAAAGVTPWAMTLQNEPSVEAAYPSMRMSAIQQSQLAVELKAQLARRGLGGIQIWGHDDNYANYQTAADIVNANPSVIDAIAFHCYNGDPSQISSFRAALQNGVTKNVHLSECSGNQEPTDRGYALQGWLSKVYWPVESQGARSILQWNLALDPGFGPHLSSSYCSQCSGSLTVSSQANPQNPFVGFNAQLFTTAHFSSATSDMTNFGGGQSVRIASSPGTQGTLSSTDMSCLNYQAYAAPIYGSSLPPSNTAVGAAATRRIGIVVANTCADTKWVTVSIDGRRTMLPVNQGLTTFVGPTP